MKSIKFVVLIALLISCSKKKVLIIKQWHLSPNEVTIDIGKSKSNPKFENQIYIYDYISNLLKNSVDYVLLAEGCEEDEKDNGLNLNYNGWNINKLKEVKNEKNFRDILAPIHMKIKVQFPSVQVVCGDSKKYIKKNLEAFSDLKGNFQFYDALKKNKFSNPKKYRLYLNALKDLHPNIDIKEPISFVTKQAQLSLDNFKKYIAKRNDFFVKKAQKFQNKNIIIVIGGLHVNDLKSKLIDKELAVDTLVPSGYVDNESLLISEIEKKLKESLNKKSYISFQIPARVDIKLFPKKNLISWDKLATKAEQKEIFTLSRKASLDRKLLQSDFDNDGVRDFTISGRGSEIILSTEDDDWDNDGIPNLADDSLGKLKYRIQAVEPKIVNRLLSTSSIVKVKSGLKNIKLLSDHHDFELMVLQALDLLINRKEFRSSKVKFFNATNSAFSYGDKVFFSYVKQSKTIEYYPKKLNSYLEKVRTGIYKNRTKADFVKGFALPLIIHSLTHELVHSLEYDYKSIAKKFDWSWKSDRYSGFYLKKYRNPTKRIEFFLYDYKYRGKNHSKWLDHFQKNNDLIIDESIPSVYATLNPSEWFAESLSMCIFVKLFPNSSDKTLLKSYATYLGINPSYDKLCSIVLI